MFKKIVFICILTLSNIGLASAFEASYYSDAFEGGTSANGTTFSQSGHTAAICYEELSQLAYVSTAQTGMVVTLTDRPNCARHTDRIDLSSSVFSTFAPLSKGLITDISATPLGIKTGKFVKRNLSQKEFTPLGVELSKPMSNTYIAGESIIVSGRVTSGIEHVMIYLEHKKTGLKKSQSYAVSNGGIFSIVLSFPQESGEYYFVIAAGTSFRTESPSSLLLVNRDDIAPMDQGTGTYKKSILTLKEISGDQVLSLPYNSWGILTFGTGSKQTLYGQVLSFDATSLGLGKARYTFTGYTLSSPSSLDRSPAPTTSLSGTVLLARKHDSLGAERVKILRQPRNIVFRFRIPAGKVVQDTYYVTLPNGDVRKYSFPKKYTDGNGYLKTNTLIQSMFSADVVGTYKLETVEGSGFAYFNLPIARGDVWNVIPKLSDAEIRNIRKSTKDVRTDSYNAINTLRGTLFRTRLERDVSLDLLAQKKAEDMARDAYVGHVTQDGKNIREFATSLSISTASSLGENVAGGNVSGAALQDGLEESGSHRANMIDPDWKKVGIGYVVSGDKTYMVHVFSN